MAAIAEDGMGDRVEGVCKEGVVASCTVGGDVVVASVAMKDEEMKKRDDVRGESEKSDETSQQQQPGNESTEESLPQEEVLSVAVNNNKVKEQAEGEEEGMDNSGEATNEKEGDYSHFVASDDLGKGESSRISVWASPSLEGKPKDAKAQSGAIGEGKGEDTAAVLSAMRFWGGNKSYRPRLNFLKPPPPAPFEGKSFEVECVLCNENAKPIELERSLALRKVRIFPTVLTPEGHISDYPLELESTAISWKDGGLLATLIFHTNILKISAPISSRRVCLMLSAEFGLSDEENGGEPGGVMKLEPLVSDAFVVVKYALEIVDGERPIPDQWFKDEGGRDNCVAFGVRLVDSEGREVLDRNVQLHLTLLYKNMHPVANQDILKVLPRSEWSLGSQSDGVKGQSGGFFRIRIEEVSRHHQKQAFRIGVEAEPVGHERTLDIRHGASKPIVVLSKRILRKTKWKAEHKERPHQNWGNEQSTPTGGLASRHRLIGQNNVDNKVGKRRGSSGQAVPPRGKVHGMNVPMDCGFVELTEMPPSAFYRALKSVISWSKEVVNSLTAIEWKLIGYETLPNNQSNFDRPLYSISDPNPLISNLLNIYARETTHCLHMLLMYHEERGGMEREQIPVEQLSAGASVEGSGSISCQPGGVHVDSQSDPTKCWATFSGSVSGTTPSGP